MNIEQIRIEREKAEGIVRAALDEFKAKTGLSIIGCEIIVTSHTSIGSRNSWLIVTGVGLEIEPL